MNWIMSKRCIRNSRNAECPGGDLMSYILILQLLVQQIVNSHLLEKNWIRYTEKFLSIAKHSHRLRNPLIGYLNINSIRNKISDREVFGKLQLDYFVFSETKIDESFPSAQFNIHDYEIRNRRDRDKHGGGFIEFVRKGFITKRMKEYETKLSEIICTEFTVSKKKWFCLSVYRPPSSNNIVTFFKELTDSLSRPINNITK